MIHTVIIDDKYGNIIALEKMLAMYCPGVTVLAKATGMEEALEAIRRLQPEMIFLDIEMPDGSGFELLERAAANDFETIFTTAYDQYAIQAFKTQALEYLLKPIDIAELQRAVEKAERQIRLKRAAQQEVLLPPVAPAMGSKKACLPALDGYTFVDYDTIVRCEASGSYSNIFLADGSRFLISMRLKECEEMLPADSFMRVHHSHVVNLRYVERYIKGRGGSLSLKDGSVIDVSNNRKEAFLAAMRRQRI